MNITSSNVVGIETEKNVLKGVSLRLKNKNLILKTFTCQAADSNVKQFYTQKSVTVAALETPDVLFRTVQIPKVFNQDLKVTLAFQIESNLSFSIDDAAFQSIPLKKEKKSLSFTTFIAKKSALENQLAKLQNWKIDPEIVASKPNALYELTPYITNFEGALLNLSQRGTTLIFVKDKKLISYKFSDIGSDSFEKRGHALLSKINEWQREITYLLHVFEKEHGEEIKSIIVTGQPFKNDDFLYQMQQNLAFKLTLPQVVTLNLSKDDFLDYALPLGLSLLASPKQINQINFRAEKTTLGFLKKNFALFYGVAAIFTMALILLTSSFLIDKEKALDEKAKNLIQLKANLLELPLKPLPEGGSFDSLLAQLESKEGQVSYPYALRPDVATVGEVLTWLNTLSVPEGIQIERIHYFLDHYPSKKAPKERYIAKVEIEFKTTNNENIRLFQEKLLEDKKLILQGKEFQFIQNKEGIRTSFVLKPKKKTV